MKAKKRIAGLMAVCMMIAAMLSGGALADSVTVTADKLNVRSEADASGRVLGVARSGDELSFVSKVGSWYQVKYGRQLGFVMEKYVDVDEKKLEKDVAENTEAMSASGVTTERVNIRTLPMADARIVRVADRKDKVEVIGRCGKWYQVKYEGKTGYLMGDYVTLSEASAPAATPAPTAAPSPTATAAPEVTPEPSATAAPTEAPAPEEEKIYESPANGRTNARVNMRQGASAQDKIVKVLDDGESVAVLGELGAWYKVTANGREGYVFGSYLTFNAAGDGLVSYPAGRGGTVTVRVNMRRSASTGSAIVKVLSAGAKITVTGEQGGFYQAESGSSIGYIAKEYVKFSGAEKEEILPENEKHYSAAKNGMTTTAVNMRAEPDGKVIHTLSADTPVVLTGELGSWYKITYKGSWGYVSKAYVNEVRSFEQLVGEGTRGYISAVSVNMRKGPGTDYGVIEVLKRGEEIRYYPIADGWHLVKAGGDVGFIAAEYVSREEPEADSPDETVRVVLGDWFKGDIQQVLDRGDEGVITDLKTGLKFNFIRTGGYYHADAQPSTSKDTEIMLKIYGGKWKWDRRAIWITVDGKTYAASMNGMPHGDTDTVKGNDFDGCFCIHFLNSKTHAGDRVDSAHQECIQEAYKAGK